MHFTQIRLLCERDLIRFEQTNLELWSMIELKSFSTHQICRFAFQAAGSWPEKVTSLAIKKRNFHFSTHFKMEILAKAMKWFHKYSSFGKAVSVILYIHFFFIVSFTKLVMVGRHIFTEFHSFAHQFYHHRLLFSLTICFLCLCSVGSTRIYFLFLQRTFHWRFN